MSVCCIPNSYFPQDWLEAVKVQNINFYSVFSLENCIWKERSVVEKDSTIKQLIPYVLVENNQNGFACYQRHGHEKRLLGVFSCGVGGHVEECDKGNNLQETLENGMFRELNEEFTDFDKSKCDISYQGIIIENKTEVGLSHVGIVYHCKLKKGVVFHAASELLNLQYFSLDDLRTMRTELWSQLALSLEVNNG